MLLLISAQCNHFISKVMINVICHISQVCPKADVIKLKPSSSNYKTINNFFFNLSIDQSGQFRQGANIYC